MPERLQIGERFDRRQHRHLRIRKSGEGEAEHGIERSDRESVPECRQQTDHGNAERLHRKDKKHKTEQQSRMAAIDRKTGKTEENDITSDSQNQINHRIRNQFADHRNRIVASGSAQPSMGSSRLEFKTDGKDGEHETNQPQDARQDCADQINGVIAPRIRDHVPLYRERLDTVHNHIIREPFLAQYLALEGTGDQIRHGKHLLVRRVSAHRICVRYIEINLRSFETRQRVIEAFRNDKNTVNPAFLHRLARLGIGIGDKLDIHGRRSLHLMSQPP